MFSFAKLLKLFLPIATVTSATIVTTFLISKKRNENDKKDKENNLVLDSIEKVLEEFEEKELFYPEEEGDKAQEEKQDDIAEKSTKKLEELMKRAVDIVDSVKNLNEMEGIESRKEIPKSIPKGSQESSSNKGSELKADKSITSSSTEEENGPSSISESSEGGISDAGASQELTGGEAITSNSEETLSDGTPLQEAQSTIQETFLERQTESAPQNESKGPEEPALLEDLPVAEDEEVAETTGDGEHSQSSDTASDDLETRGNSEVNARPSGEDTKEESYADKRELLEEQLRKLEALKSEMSDKLVALYDLFK